MPNRIDTPDSGSLPEQSEKPAPPVVGDSALRPGHAAGVGMSAVEERLFGHPYVEAIVIAILLGTAIRSLATGPRSTCHRLQRQATTGSGCRAA